ncbi:hypothetical protein N431DRAFT_56917 [Stipitochalara longipes BDJ]|nr:hypothetical protein N431DRAFT_56917 [Stipitochalara longipes BDJ]
MRVRRLDVEGSIDCHCVADVVLQRGFEERRFFTRQCKASTTRQASRGATAPRTGSSCDLIRGWVCQRCVSVDIFAVLLFHVALGRWCWRCGAGCCVEVLQIVIIYQYAFLREIEKMIAK